MTARVDTIVEGGRVVTASEAYDAAIAITGGRIVAIGPAALLPLASRRIDATGKYVLPGAIDSHVHFGWDYDGWRQGSVAAAHAGLTTFVAFALYDDQAGQTLPQALATLVPEVSAQSVLDFGFHFILKNQPYVLAGIPEAVALGVTSFKMFMTYKKRPGMMCTDDLLAQAMEAIAAAGGLCQLHCENGDILYHLENKAIAAGRTRPTDFPATAPGWAEAEAINRAIEIARLTGCPLYVVHLSTRSGLDRIKAAQAAGQPVYAETCPQYLLLDERAMVEWGPLAKIGPPLRGADGADQTALWRGLEQGYLATLASDHSARAKAAKEPGWRNIFVDAQGKTVPFGSPSVETLVPLAYSEGVVGRGLPLTFLARVLAENPARLFGLWPRKGTIRVGADADLLLYDPEPEWTIRAADQKGIAGYTLYEGRRVKGRPWMTLVRGREVLRPDGTLGAPPGYGQFVPRTGPLPPLAGPVR